MFLEKFCDHTAPPVSPNTACMNGYDSGTIQGIYTPEECAQLCQDDPACRAFEYRKAPNGRSTGTCFKWVKCTLFWPLSGLTYTKCEFPAEQGENFLLFHWHFEHTKTLVKTIKDIKKKIRKIFIKSVSGWLNKVEKCLVLL